MVARSSIKSGVGPPAGVVMRLGLRTGSEAGEDDTAGMRPYISWFLDNSMILQARTRSRMSGPAYTSTVRSRPAFVHFFAKHENSGAL
jgi:hypothetical protein